MKHRDRRPDTVMGALTWFALSYGMAIAGYFAINVIASRWLGKPLFGTFVIILTVSTVLGQIGLAGVHRGGLRDAAVMDYYDESSLRLLQSGALVATRVTLPLVGILGGAVAGLILGDNVIEQILFALTFGALAILSGLQKLWASYLRGLGETKLAGLLEGRSGGGVVSVAQAVAMLLAWLLFPGTGLLGAAVALTLGFLGSVGYAGRRVRRRWRHLPNPARWLPELTPTLSRSWRFGVNQVSVFLGANVELWIGGLLLVDSSASLFSAAQRLAMTLAIPLTSVQVVFAPAAARLLRGDNPVQLQRLLRTGATLAMAVSAVLLVPMLLIPRQVLSVVYPPEFSAAAPALVILTLATVANVLTGLCGTALTMSHYEGLVAGVQATTVVFQIAFGLLAAHFFGIQGLAASAATFVGVNYFVQWVLARRLLGVWTHPTLRPSLRLLRATDG